MTPNQIKAYNKALEIMETAGDMYCVPMTDVVIKFNLRGQCGGQAIRDTMGRYSIRLNKTAVESHLEEMLTRTIGHEIAHIVCMKDRSLGKNHNSGWQRVDIALGGDGTRCHDMDLKKVRNVKRFKYVASCGTEVELTSIIHKRMQNGEQTRRIRSTGGKLTAQSWVGHRSHDKVAEPKPDLIDVVLGWNNHSQMVQVAELLERGHAKLVSAEDGCAVLANDKKQVLIDARGERTVINMF